VVFPETSGLPDTLFRVSDSVRDFRRVVPVGGNSMIVTNLELRLPSPFLPDLLQWTLFTDGGDVWNRGEANSFQNFSFKITPGIQLTAFSPVGPVRIVIGYNPYRRPAGPLYYEVPTGSADAGGPPAGSLPCVSPGNLLPVHLVTDPVTNVSHLIQSEGHCPAVFTPKSSNSFRSRLTFGLAIGQAF
jgi:hypothetical protein